MSSDRFARPEDRPAYYTGVGSRSAPEEVQQRARLLGRLYASRGMTLRSGHAVGIDQAFERGADGLADIYLPWETYEMYVPPKGRVHVGASAEAKAIAAALHPAWDRLSPGVQLLMGRNVYQVLGDDLNTPSDFVVAWTPPPFPTGGTALAVNLALSRGISVLYLGSRYGRWPNEQLQLEVTDGAAEPDDDSDERARFRREGGEHDPRLALPDAGEGGEDT